MSEDGPVAPSATAAPALRGIPRRPAMVLIDVDGTLVDSRASIFQAATDAARDLGLPDPEYDRVRQIVGLSLPHALAVLEGPGVVALDGSAA